RGRNHLTHRHLWLASLFAAAAVPLFFLSQPGLGPLFMAFCGMVAGAILAAEGLDSLAHALRARAPAGAERTWALAAVGLGMFVFFGLLQLRLGMRWSAAALPEA